MREQFKAIPNPLQKQILIRLSEFYKVSVDYLLGLTDNPKQNR